MTKKVDVIVIGAGIAGVATALHLLSKGRDVTLIDQHIPGRDASFGNAGVLETSYTLPIKPPSLRSIPNFFLGNLPSARIKYPEGLRYIPWMIDLYRHARADLREKSGQLLWPLVHRAAQEHQYLMADTNATDFVRPYTRLKIYRTKASFDGAQAERQMAVRLGVPFEELDLASAQLLEPLLKPVFYRAIHYPSTQQITSPFKVIQAYADKFVRMGGKIAQQTVMGLQQIAGESWNLSTEKDTYTASHVVVCGGAHTPQFLKPLGYKFPMGVKRGYHQHFELTQGSLRFSVLDVDVGFVVAPNEKGIRLTTGAEFSTPDSAANPIQIYQTLPYAKSLVPLGRALDGTPWKGSRACFADSLPVIDRAPHHAGLWLNFGHGHLGMTIGPVTGRLLSEIMCGEKTICNPSPYRADRFNKG